MDKYSELLSSFFSQLRERLTSPLLGSFIFFWLVFNWKPVSVYLFSDKTVEESIQHIQLNYSDAQINFWYPLFATLTYLVVYPVFSWASFSLWEWFEKTKGSTRAKIFNSEYLTVDQSLALKQRYADKHEEILKVLKLNESEIANINQKLESEQSEIKNLKSQNNELADSLSSIEGINLADILPIPEISRKFLLRYKNDFELGFNILEHMNSKELSSIYGTKDGQKGKLSRLVHLDEKESYNQITSDIFKVIEPLVSFKIITRKSTGNDDTLLEAVYSISNFGRRYLDDLSKTD